MKSELLKTVREIVSLLNDCELYDRAAWFLNCQKELEEVDDSPTALAAHARELRGIIAGMGSFSDLSLEPSEASQLSEAEAIQMKWKLADELDEITGQILRASGDRKGT